MSLAGRDGRGWESMWEMPDPDGIVDAVRFADGVECEECLAAGPRWVREPLGEWLNERWSETRAYRYRVEGTDRASLVVSRR